MNETELVAELTGIKVRLAKLEQQKAAPIGETSTERPRFDFEIKIGRDKGKKPSELSSTALDSLAAWMTKCAENPQPGKEQYVDSNRKAAGNYKRWAAYRRAVEQGLVADVDVGEYGTSGHGGSAKHTAPNDDVEESEIPF